MVRYFNRLAVVDASGADVNRGGGEATHIGEQVRFGVMCEVVGLGDAEGRIARGWATTCGLKASPSTPFYALAQPGRGRH
jgi:hypothetical protein